MRVPKHLPTGSSGTHGVTGTLGNGSAFVLGHGRENVQRQPVGLRAVAGDELNARIQNASNKLDVTGQPVQFGDYQCRTSRPATTQRSSQLRPVSFTPALNFGELGQQASTANMAQHGNPLGFEPQTALALLHSRNPEVRYEPCHVAPCYPETHTSQTDYRTLRNL
jgi:hypothetical protein